MSQKGSDSQTTREVMQSGQRRAPGEPTPGASGLDPENLIGQTIAGRYQVERVIGRGGMGLVYLAQQLAVRRKVVVKVLPRTLREDQRARRRFEREARGLSTLQHPNVVTLHDFGYEAELPYIVMEYVEGETLSRVMRRRRRLDLRDFLPLAAQILSAIGEAHHQGLIHRDLKPDNIMLCERNGRKNFVKILDFGLARLLNDSEEITQHNLMGTALYLSPEQIMGRKLDQRSDVYSLGVLFYLLLCGKKPFAGKEDVNLLFQHVNQQPEPLALQLPRDHDIPRPLIQLIHRCLDKDVARRPFDANEVLRLMREEVSFSGLSVPHFAPNLDSARPSQLRIPALGFQTNPHDSFVGPDTGSHSQHDSTESNPVAAGTQAGRGTIEMPVVVQVPGVNVPHFSEDSGSRLRPTHVFLMLLCVLLVGAGLYLLLMDNKQAGETQRVQQVLLHAETLINQERFGEAEYLLTSIEKDHTNQPGELLRVANLRERLDVSRLLMEARQREMQRDSQGATQLYREILRRNAGHLEAQRRLNALLAQPEAKTDGAAQPPETPKDAPKGAPSKKPKRR